MIPGAAAIAPYLSPVASRSFPLTEIAFDPV